VKRFDLPLYPIAVGLALLLQLIALNGVGVWVSFRSILFVLVLSIVVTVALRALLGDRDRAGLAAILAMFALTAADHRLVPVVAIVILILFVERRVIGGRLHVQWPRIGQASRIFALIICLAIVIQAVQVGSPGILARSLTDEGPFKAARTFTGTVSPQTPDIYVILLDGYARGDALQQVFGVDDRPFLDALRQRGFSVSSKALTNYPNTVQVLMAMFNMALLPDIPRLAPVLSGTTAQAQIGITHSVVMQNPLFDDLHDRGYEIVAMSSGFAEVSLREADRFISAGSLNEVEIGLLRRTVFGDLLDTVAPDYVSSQFRDRIQANFAALHMLSAEHPAFPRFVFAHFPSPHPPWVFHADGTPRTVSRVGNIYADDPASTGLTEDELKDGYAESAEYLQQPVLDAVDAIDRSSAVPPVIVVFGDHGSWVGAVPGDVRLRFLPLLAARVPGKTQALPDDETLVNVFPDLLDPLLGASFPRVDPAPSFMFGAGGEYDLHQLDDPNGAIRTP
jgi:hypothetical protein